MGRLPISKKQGKDVAAFLNQTPTALDEWSRIENPELKCEVAKEMNKLYQTMAQRDKIRKNKMVLEEYFRSPSLALEKWSKIEDPKTKCEEAKKMKRLYQAMGEWGRPQRRFRETKNVLEEYFKTTGKCQEDTT